MFRAIHHTNEIFSRTFNVIEFDSFFSFALKHKFFITAASRAQNGACCRICAAVSSLSYLKVAQQRSTCVWPSIEANLAPIHVRRNGHNLSSLPEPTTAGTKFDFEHTRDTEYASP